MDGTADRAGDDWDAFDRPIFDDPEARALSRVGVIDVGSNSVRMVVFDGAARSPAYFFNEKILCGLGAGLLDTGRLNPEGRKRAFAAIKRFAKLARAMKVAPLTAVATAAVREAADGQEFVDEVEAATHLHIRIVDGREEARLSSQGVLLGWPGARGLVCDIGGSSMELALVGNGEVGKRVTSSLGPLKLRDIKGGKKGLRDHIRSGIDDLIDQMDADHNRLYLVGGSWRAIARLDMERRGYPLSVLHEYKMTRRDIQKTVNWIYDNDLEELRARTGTSAERMSLVPLAGKVLKGLVSGFSPRKIYVSSYGIREGLLYEQMPDRLRRRDPLIEACRYSEQQNARLPGFGKKLYHFILPLFPGADLETLRLIRAACLLHDVSWRAHPDYRAEVCFDNATRANLGGLDHRGRVFLGIALLHRYKNTRPGRFESLLSLLDERDIRLAEVVGKAMRFGSMFTVRQPELMGKLHWQPKKRVLHLKLTPESVDLFGEVAEARFEALVSALGGTSRIRWP